MQTTRKAALCVLMFAVAAPAYAGVVTSKFGARATVSDAHVAAFQAYVNDLEANGATIRFMGGYRKGHCSSRHMHSCNKALDVCQTGRGRVDPRCNLPGRAAIAAIAARHGLFEGGQWCHSDYGHAQVGASAPACGERILAAKRSSPRRQVDANGNISHRRHAAAQPGQTDVALTRDFGLGGGYLHQQTSVEKVDRKVRTRHSRAGTEKRAQLWSATASY